MLKLAILIKSLVGEFAFRIRIVYLNEILFLDAMLEIPTILAKHWTEVVGLLAIASGIEKKRLEDLDLDEATMIVEAVIEVNNFFGIKDRYDKMMMRKVIAEKQQKPSMSAPRKK